MSFLEILQHGICVKWYFNYFYSFFVGKMNFHLAWKCFIMAVGYLLCVPFPKLENKKHFL